MFAQKKSLEISRAALAKWWRQELAAKFQEKIIYSVCGVHTLTYMPWLPARPCAAIGDGEKGYFRGGDLLASLILRSVFSRSLQFRRDLSLFAKTGRSPGRWCQRATFKK